MSFDPFAVQCLTCGSRLRVTDPAIVGTIAACPKCGSMVQIDRSAGASVGPTGQVAVGSSGVDSEAITEDAIDAANDPAEAATGSGFTDSDTAASRDLGETGGDVPSLMLPAWQSERTERSRQIALVVAISISSLIAATLFFGWFVRSWRQQSTANVAETDVLESDPNTSTAEPESVAWPDPAVESPDANSSPPQPNLEPDAPADPEISADPQSAPTTPSEPPADLVPPSPIVAVAPPGAAADNPPAGGDVGTLQEIPANLMPFMKLLESEGAGGGAAAVGSTTRAADIKIDDAAEDAIDPMMIAIPPKPININAALAIKMAIDSRGYPMSDLILFIGQITGVPIQLDWVSFDLAGIDVRATVKVDRQMKSAADLLNEIAAGIGAEVRREEAMLIFTVSDQAFAEKLGELTTLDDFGVGRDSAIKVLNDFLAGDDQIADDELQLGSSREEQQLAGLAVESLRRMRDIAPLVPDQRLHRWAQSAESESIQWQLISGGNAGEQLFAPITISGLLRRTARNNHATCLVNWFDAGRRRVSPEQLVMPYAGVDAGSMLTQTLAPFEMQVRQVDAMHWWVGTAATYDRLPMLVWSPPLGEGRQDFIHRLNTVMAGAPRETYRLAIDAQSDRGLLLLPRFIVRQLEKIQVGIAAR